MRIRKRKVPLPLSSLSPVSIHSDPNFNQSSVVQLQLDQNPPGNLSLIADAASYFDHPQPLDHPIGDGSNGLDHGGLGSEVSSKVCLEEDERRIDGERSNDSRKEDVLSEEIETMVLKQSSYPHQAVGRWHEGEKAFPVKKRRVSLERNKPNEEASTSNGKRIKTKTNKKCEQPNGNKDQQQQLEYQMKETKKDASLVNTYIASGSSSNNGAKKRGRGGALMEGSRCSRVNGRGWRCCQQTLVGYSLCEHHLGKGRLRSMNNVRSRSKSTCTGNIAPNEDNSQPLSFLGSSLSLEDKQELKPKVEDQCIDGGHGSEDHQEKQPLIVKKRKLKLGMVKARSLSSLLGLANEAISMAENENK